MVIKRSDIVNQVQKLCDGGAIAGLTDAQLLERFTTRHGEEAELAFAGLLARHGPMVLGVCRGLLRNPQDAEDAFQAAFLVLARKAHSLRRPDLVGPWLYGVAHRSACQIRTGNARRRWRETEAAMSRNRSGVEAGDREFRPAAPDEIEALHEEIDRLPERYRIAVVLCDLQGLTHEEAARRLGRPVGTVSARLSRARERLKGQLSRRGMALPATAVTAALATSNASAMPAALVDSTIEVAMAVSAGLTAGVVPASIATLSQGVSRAMFLTNLKTISAAVLLGMAAVGSMAVVIQPSRAPWNAARTNNPVQAPASRSELNHRNEKTPLLLAAGEQNVNGPAAPSVDLVLAGRVMATDGQPVAEAVVLVSGLDRVDQVVTVLARGKSDAGGRFRVIVPGWKDPRQRNLPLALWAHRPGRVLGAVGLDPKQIPAEDSLVVKVGPPRAMEFRVVAADGAPAAGVKVAPNTYALNEAVSGAPIMRLAAFPMPGELTERFTATTGGDGRCRIADLAPETIRSERIESVTTGVQLAECFPDGNGLTTIKLGPVGRFVGRLVPDDPTRSVAGLRVFIGSQPDSRQPSSAFSQVEAVTDASGRFEVAALTAGRLVMYVSAPAGSGLSPRPPQDFKVVPGKLNEVLIPVQTPAKVRSLTGRVLDRAGKPVAGATVFQTGDAPARTSTDTAGDGTFTLPGVARGSTFVFARVRGFRFTGKTIGPNDDNISITLIRTTETPSATMATLPPPLAPTEEQALARQVIDPYAQQVLARGNQNEKFQLITVLARAEPARVLELIDRKAFTDPNLIAAVRMQVVLALRVNATDEALAVIETMDDPGIQAGALLAVCDSLPASDRAKRLELIAHAVVEAKASKSPAYKLVMLGQAAEHWLDLGETDRGKALLKECQPLARAMQDAAFDGFAKSTFAEGLAQVDCDAALQLTKNLSNPGEFDRHHGNIAHKLAARDPAAAERVLGMIKDNSFQRDQYAVRVIYRMSRVDLDRARRLAQAIGEPSHRGFGLGMAALSLAEAGKKDAAATLLAEAFDALERQAEPGKPQGSFDRASTAAALLPVAERIDPALVPESFWRVLSLRPSRTLDVYDPGVRSDLRLAVGLARYDRALARTLLEPHVGRQAPSWVPAVDGLPAFTAAACIDPRWAVSLVEALPDDVDLKANSTKNSARLAVAAALSRRGEGRWRYLQQRCLQLWVPDTLDVAPDL